MSYCQHIEQSLPIFVLPCCLNVAIGPWYRPRQNREVQFFAKMGDFFVGQASKQASRLAPPASSSLPARFAPLAPPPPGRGPRCPRPPPCERGPRCPHSPPWQRGSRRLCPWPLCWGHPMRPASRCRCAPKASRGANLGNALEPVDVGEVKCGNAPQGDGTHDRTLKRQ